MKRVPEIFFEQKHWFCGIALVGAGIIFSRVLSPRIEAANFLLMLAGHALCLAGFFAIILGIYRKNRAENPDEIDDDEKLDDDEIS